MRWLGETADGAIWAVVKPGGVVRIDRDSGSIRKFGAADGLACGTSHRGFVDHLDRLWIATSCGVFRNDRPSSSGAFRRIDQPAQFDAGAWAFSEDKQGTMFITNPDGIVEAERRPVAPVPESGWAGERRPLHPHHRTRR